jgi:hypothetical protein
MRESLHPRRIATLCASLALTATLSACEDDDSVLFPGVSREVNEQLTVLHDSMTPFQDVESAIAAGYGVIVEHPTDGSRCLAHHDQGAMGFHYLNPDLADDAVAVSSPEALLYEPRSDGSLELVGAEYVVPFAVRSDTETPPVLFGREFSRNYTFNVWALHVWVLRDNPNGVFSDWNPTVSCEHADAVG